MTILVKPFTTVIDLKAPTIRISISASEKPSNTFTDFENQAVITVTDLIHWALK